MEAAIYKILGNNDYEPSIVQIYHWGIYGFWVFWKIAFPGRKGECQSSEWWRFWEQDMQNLHQQCRHRSVFSKKCNFYLDYKVIAISLFYKWKIILHILSTLSPKPGHVPAASRPCSIWQLCCIVFLQEYRMTYLGNLKSMQYESQILLDKLWLFELKSKACR